MKKFLAVVLEMTMHAMAEITFSCKGMARHGIAFHFRAVIGLTALSLLNCVALGQVVVSGSAVLSGNVQLGSGLDSAPLTYSARTDGCVNPTATPGSCIAGTTTGQAGATLLFQEGISDPIPTGFVSTTISSGSCPSGLTPSTYPAYCPAPMNATATDPDFNSYLVMASDENTQPNGNPWVVSWASAFAFSQDETLATITGTNGQTILLNINPTSIHAKTCATSPCVNKTGIFASGSGSSTRFINNASITASPRASEPTTFYEQAGTLVNKLVVTSSIASPGTGTMVRTAYADFANGSGGYGGVLPDITVGANTSSYLNYWTGTFNMAYDGSLGFGMTGGYYWLPSWTPADVVGNTIFIVPVLNNPSKHGYQATTIGATGATEPVWNGAGCTSYAAGATCTDGGTTWTDIGVVNGQGPGFDIISYRPSLGYSRVNTRLAKIYRGTGNSAPAGAITTTDPVASTRATGAPGSTVNLPDVYTLHAVLQPPDGTYMSFGPTGGGAALAPGNWNSGTLTCQSNGGSFVWAGAWNSATTYTNKKIVSYTDGTSAYYAATTAGSNLNQIPRTGGTVNTTYWTQQEAYCTQYYWNVATTLVSPTTAWGATGGHTNPGFLYRYYGNLYTAGSYGTPSAQASPPSGPITLNPGTAAMSAPFCSDDHGDYSNDGTQDLQPMFSAGDDVPAWPTRYTCAGYSEVVGVKNAVTGASPGTYRFAHVYNTGDNTAYAVQQNLPVVSPLGDLLLVGTDMMGTRGDLSTKTTQCNNARGMFLPQTGMTLSVNDTLYPMASNAGNYVYNTTVGGLTSGAAPTGGWCQTASCTAAWGAATVQNIGANTCRGDTMIVDLTSAHAAAGNTINAASCSSANVLSAIASASNGDTVVVPAGTCTWTTPSSNVPTITLTKQITLQGQTTCSGSPVTCTDGTIINDGTTAGFDENLIDDNADNSRITGFSFKDPRNLSDSKYPVQFSCSNCRFDHNSVTQANAAGATHGLYVYSKVSGTQLVDHNYFADLNGAADVDGTASDAHFPGDTSWATALTLGSANATYIEANNFTCDYAAVACPLDGAYDAYAGARVVFRFNTLTNYNLGGHGLDSGGLRSTLLQEVYGNTMTTPGTHIYTAMGTRGGTHLIFNNTVSASGGSYDSFLWMQEYRSSSGYSWGSPSGALCGGSTTNNIDSNASHGWICRDQVGRGPETAPSNDWPVNTSSPTFSEASFPGYEWGNSFKGSAPTTSDIAVCDAVPDCSTSNATLYQIFNNRDFYMEDATNCVPGGACTQGTATGTWANRPTSCTVGTGYWAIDLGSWNQSGSGGQGQFYTCSSGNTWTLYYTPYTYPHPSQ